MVWICTKCNGKNQNSSVKCRINKCHEPKPIQIIQKQIQKELKFNQRDFCPVCKTHRDFKRKDSKNRWTCSTCHRTFRFKGKPIPEDPIITKELTKAINESKNGI